MVNNDTFRIQRTRYGVGRIGSPCPTANRLSPSSPSLVKQIVRFSWIGFAVKQVNQLSVFIEMEGIAFVSDGHGRAVKYRFTLALMDESQTVIRPLNESAKRCSLNVVGHGHTAVIKNGRQHVDLSRKFFDHGTRRNHPRGTHH